MVFKLRNAPVKIVTILNWLLKLDKLLISRNRTKWQVFMRSCQRVIESNSMKPGLLVQLLHADHTSRSDLFKSGLYSSELTYLPTDLPTIEKIDRNAASRMQLISSETHTIVATFSSHCYHWEEVTGSMRSISVHVQERASSHQPSDS